MISKILFILKSNIASPLRSKKLSEIILFFILKKFFLEMEVSIPVFIILIFILPKNLFF